MSYTAADVIAIAAAEVGYREKASNRQLEDPTGNAGSSNWNKYAAELYEAGYYGGHNKNGFAWCAIFNDFCHYMAAGKNRQLAQSVSCQSGIYGAACNYSAMYYKQAGRFDKTPSVGAQIYFGDSSSWKHTGIVEAFDDDTVTTIEGNSNNAVQRKTYKRTNSTILGYGHPRYGDEVAEEKEVPAAPAEETADADKTLPVLKYRTIQPAVGALQLLLNFRTGSVLAVDNDYGEKTRAAVKAWQKERALDVDGICGPITWASLIKDK